MGVVCCCGVVVSWGVVFVVFSVGNRSVGAKRYAARGSGALSVVGCTWGSRDGDGVPVRWAAQAAVR